MVKNSTIAIMAAAGIGLFWLLNRAKPASAAGPSFWENPAISDNWASQGGPVPTITGRESVAESINKINVAANAGATFQRQSSTQLKGVTATGGPGSSFPGQTLTGNIAQLTTSLKGDTKKVFVAVTKPTGGGIEARIRASGTTLRGGRPAVAGA